MAFNIGNLTYVSGNNLSNVREGRTWAYNSGSDNIATVDVDTYFDNGASVLRLGDLIKATCSNGNVVYYVTSTDPSAPVTGFIKLSF